MELKRITKDSVNEFVGQFEIVFNNYKELLDPGNEIDAAPIRLGFAVMNLEGTVEYPHGGYLSIDEEGYPVGFSFREFEDTFDVALPVAADSTSMKRKLGKMGDEAAPDDGPDAVADAGEGTTVESIGPDDGDVVSEGTEPDNPHMDDADDKEDKPTG